MTVDDYVWRPTQDVIEDANLTRFMRHCAIADYDALVAWSNSDPEAEAKDAIWENWDDFTAKAPESEIAGFMRSVGEVTRQLELDGPGYRLLVNMGGHGHQEVPHPHVHIFGGRQFFQMIPDCLMVLFEIFSIRDSHHRHQI